MKLHNDNIANLMPTCERAPLNSHADGMAVAQPYSFSIDFVRNPISGSTAWFFVIILKFIFTPIFEIKIQEKKFLDNKKFRSEFSSSRIFKKIEIFYFKSQKFRIFSRSSEFWLKKSSFLKNYASSYLWILPL